MKFTTTQTSVKSGRLSRKLDGRIDIKEYPHGCRVLQNAVVMPQGGARKVQGINLINDGANDPLQFMIDGSYNHFHKVEGDVYRISVHYAAPNMVVRLYDDTETLQLTGTILVGVAVTDPKLVEFTQFNERVYVTINSPNFDFIPIYYYKDPAGTLTSNGIADGTVKYLQTPYLGPNSDYNKRLKISGSGTQLELVDSAGTTLSAAVDSIANYVGVGEYIHVVGIVDVAGNKFIHSNYFRVSSVTATTAVCVSQFAQAGGATAYVPDGTYGEWYYPAWGINQGWPKTAVAFDGRLIYAGTRKKPCTVFGSAVGDPLLMSNKRLITSEPSNEGFTYTVGQDGGIINTDPFVFTLATKRDTEIRFMQATRNLIIGTDERIYINRNEGGIIGPQNISVVPNVTVSSNNLAITYDNNVVFAADGYTKLVEISYSDDNGSFVKKDISLLSDDLYEGTEIRQLSFDENNGLLVVTMENGLVHLVSLSRASDVLAYSTATIAGFEFKSVVYNPFTRICFASLYNAALTFQVNQQAYWDLSESVDPRDFITQTISWDKGFASDYWTYDIGAVGDVVYWYDENSDASGVARLGDFKEFTTPTTYTHLHIGYAQEMEVCLMPIEAGMQFGTAQMAIKRVDQIGVRVYNSLSFRFKELNSGYEEQVITTQDGVTPVSGQFVRTLSASSDREQIICVSNDRAEPFTLVSISMRGVSNDG